MYSAASSMGYDRVPTTFSPDGKLYQVDYALEAVKRGWITVGVRAVDGVVLAVEKKRYTRLIDPVYTEKIFKIDDHIGAVFAGLSPDARFLIDQARVYGQMYKLVYDEPIDVEALTRYVCDLMHEYTLHGGARPFGVSLMIGGVFKGAPRLYGTDPGGAYAGYFANAIGSGYSTVLEYFEKNYDEKIALDDAIVLALKAMGPVVEGGLSSGNFEVAVIPTSTGVLEKLLPEKVMEYVSKAKS
ncbi:MAG: archaeal proteasome endopeptidase complex subunit alpha [Thermoprotei archaeon]|nr:archaeal proteasome endopeptidase complex subunit alpha [TACK group archaeon]